MAMLPFWLLGLLKAGLWKGWDGVFLFPDSYGTLLPVFSVAQGNADEHEETLFCLSQVCRAHGWV